jgi:hypothetical protein
MAGLPVFYCNPPQPERCVYDFDGDQTDVFVMVVAILGDTRGNVEIQPREHGQDVPSEVSLQVPMPPGVIEDVRLEFETKPYRHVVVFLDKLGSKPRVLGEIKRDKSTGELVWSRR